MKNKKIFAVTGGIGCGKSEVTKILSSLGYPTFSCDEIYKNLLKEKATVDAIGKVFPDCVKKGALDTKKLSQEVFCNNEKLALLNSVTHPLILEKLFALAGSLDSDTVFAEVPLFFEANLKGKFDGAIVVKRNLQSRIASVISRSGLTEEEVIKRINCQFGYDNADLSEFTVIENDGNLVDLTETVKSAIKNLVD